MSKLPIANINEVSTEEIGNGENFKARLGRFTDLLGMKGLGCNLVELAPGDKAWPFHLHYGTEEMFVVLSGQGKIRYDQDEHLIKEGDIIYTPTGEGTAHQIINDSQTTLKYLALSNNVMPDFCYYPDSGKYAAYTRTEKGGWKGVICHESELKQYYDGETS